MPPRHRGVRSHCARTSARSWLPGGSAALGGVSIPAYAMMSRRSGSGTSYAPCVHTSCTSMLAIRCMAAISVSFRYTAWSLLVTISNLRVMVAMRGLGSRWCPQYVRREAASCQPFRDSPYFRDDLVVLGARGRHQLALLLRCLADSRSCRIYCAGLAPSSRRI